MTKIEYNLVIGQPNIWIDSFSEKIGITWENGNIYDKSLIQTVYYILASKSEFFVAIDVGAQTGCFSLLAAFFPNSRWIAFEPLLEAAETLKTNLLLNDIQNVHVFQMALSDSSCRKMLKKSDEMKFWGHATLGESLRIATKEEREVECIDLDSFVAGHPIEKVKFIKIDTEGWELFILRGAINLIMRDRPIILMECNPLNMNQCNIRPEDIIEFLQAINYEWKPVSFEDILCTPKETPLHY